MKTDAELREQLQKIRLLALDSDGVLTDGGVYVFDDGREFRRFDIKDGQGLKQIMVAGIRVAIISSAASQSVVHRSRVLGIDEVHIGVSSKLVKLLEICDRLTLSLDQVAYIGDDLPDMPPMEKVGLPCATLDAMPIVRSLAQFVTSHPGGFGAVREICDLLLTARKPADSPPGTPTKS